MKCNVNKVAVLVTLLIAGLMILSGCLNHNPAEPSKPKPGKIYVPQAQDNPMDILLGSYDARDTLVYSANVGGVGASNSDIIVEFSVNTSLVSKYNSAHSTSFDVLPQDNYILSTKTDTIAAGDKKGALLKLIIKNQPNPLPNDTKYLLPITLTQSGGETEINKNLQTLYYVVKSHVIKPKGQGTKADPYKITKLFNLKWISRNPQSWGSTYIQTKDIDATQTQNWNSGEGIAPIGNKSTEFTGSYNGQGHTISGLNINRPGESVIGFFGYVGADGIIKNVHLKNVTIIGDHLTGGLVASNFGKIVGSEVSKGLVKATGNNADRSGGLVASNKGLIKNSFTNVKMLGNNDYMGGLVGKQFDGGVIKGSHAAGDVKVNGSDPDQVAGLVGENRGKILNSYATGNVNAVYGKDGGENTGGLVGRGYGVVKNSYATGDVKGAGNTAGLVGSSHSSIFRCYATGDVIGKAANSMGGLVGWAGKKSKIKESFATGNVVKTESAGNIGALVGDTHGLVLNSYALGNVNSSGGNTGGVVGYLGGGTVKHTYTAGGVSATGNADMGGVIGDQGGPNNGHGVSDSYWNIETSGLTELLGSGSAKSSGEGLTTSQMQGTAAKSNMNGFDFSNIWKTNPGGYPTLRNNPPPNTP